MIVFMMRYVNSICLLTMVQADSALILAVAVVAVWHDTVYCKYRRPHNLIRLPNPKIQATYPRNRRANSGCARGSMRRLTTDPSRRWSSRGEVRARPEDWEDHQFRVCVSLPLHLCVYLGRSNADEYVRILLRASGTCRAHAYVPPPPTSALEENMRIPGLQAKAPYG